MSIKSAVRDRSFVKFLVGGIILLVLTGGGIALVKKFRPIVGGDGADKEPVVVAGDNQNKAMAPIADDSQEEENGDVAADGVGVFPSDRVDDNTQTTIVASASLPRTGPVDTVSQIFLLGSVVYGLAYAISNRRH